ncbi:hypothetical protein DF186_25110, partial [Enterococcus hirae]
RDALAAVVDRLGDDRPGLEVRAARRSAAALLRRGLGGQRGRAQELVQRVRFERAGGVGRGRRGDLGHLGSLRHRDLG